MIPQKLIAEKEMMSGTIRQDSYNVLAYNQAGNRFFRATRRCIEWNDNKGNYMPFGGGTYWEVRYGEVVIICHNRRDPFGGKYQEYEWGFGKTYGTVVSNDGQKIIIPTELATKKEVMTLLKSLECRGFKDLKEK